MPGGFPLGVFFQSQNDSKLFSLELSHKADGLSRTCSGRCKINGLAFTAKNGVFYPFCGIAIANTVTESLISNVIYLGQCLVIFPSHLWEILSLFYTKIRCKPYIKSVCRTDEVSESGAWALHAPEPVQSLWYRHSGHPGGNSVQYVTHRQHDGRALLRHHQAPQGRLV